MILGWEYVLLCSLVKPKNYTKHNKDHHKLILAKYSVNAQNNILESEVLEYFFENRENTRTWSIDSRHVG